MFVLKLALWYTKCIKSLFILCISNKYLFVFNVLDISESNFIVEMYVCIDHICK